MIIDRAILITGSFNFSKAAQEKNAENLLIITDTNLAAIYIKNWETRLAASEPLMQYRNYVVAPE